MAPVKFASVRYKQKPVMGRASFRDDTHLIALRYDKTVAAEPPIPLPPPKSQSRQFTRPHSSSSSSGSGTLSSQTSYRPVIIIPPGTTIEPPAEEHPALRTPAPRNSAVPRTTSAATASDWKRDSGLATSPSITTTIREEYCEDNDLVCRGKLDKLANGDNTATTVVQRLTQSQSATSVEDDANNQRGSASSDDQRLNGAACAINTTATNTAAVASQTPILEPAAAASSAGDSYYPPSFPQTRPLPTHGSDLTATSRSSSTLPTRQLSQSVSIGSSVSLSNTHRTFSAESLMTMTDGDEPPARPSGAPTSTTKKLLMMTANSEPIDTWGPESRSDEQDRPSQSKPLERGQNSKPLNLMATMPVGTKDACIRIPGTHQPEAPGPLAVPGGQAPSNLDSAGPQHVTHHETAASDSTAATNHMVTPKTSPRKRLIRPVFTVGANWNNGTKLKSTKTRAASASSHFWSRSHSQDTASSSTTAVSETNDPFSPLAVSIPTPNFVDDDFITSLSFSNRGSVMFGGQRVLAVENIMDRQSVASNGPDLDNAHDPNGHDIGSSNANGITESTKEGPDNSATDDNTHPSLPEQVPAAQHHPESQADSQADSQSHEQLSSSNDPAPSSQDATPAAIPRPRDHLTAPDIRVLEADVEKESQKVRSLYAVGDDIRWEDGARFSYCEPLETTPEAPLEEDIQGAGGAYDTHRDLLEPGRATPRSGTSSSQLHETYKKTTELAGGLEDWDDVDEAQVDRYGFISIPRPSSSRLGTPTELKSAQFSPSRRRNVLQKRDPTGYSSPLGPRRAPSRKVSARSLNTQHSELSTTSLRSSRSVFRQAGNLLPHNRHRRWMDEAGEMLTVSPSMQDLAEEAKVEKISENLKRKEWERSEKWRKMAKIVSNGSEGQGMEFEFDAKNAKLIERTWKGIPDRWRGAAWWSFLASAARECEGSATADKIIKDFHDLQERSSPDDVQIDLDVPRTINRHIMFRRRYRGGQRLLFRVLHAISIYYPKTGYVQGMASLAATLLCYFDEEKCFVMMVRMWQLRGLDRLYQPGFDGLMAALDEFQKSWLPKDIAERLTELCVDPTAYGTRWYLTLFNLSIPFPAQLRVWDVFLLLGNDPSLRKGQTVQQPQQQAKSGMKSASSAAPGGMDVLHATSTALIQALREVLVDADFENAMRALTSWIPIKDEELLMKVTKSEWKSHNSKKKA